MIYSQSTHYVIRNLNISASKIHVLLLPRYITTSISYTCQKELFEQNALVRGLHSAQTLGCSSSSTQPSCSWDKPKRIIHLAAR